jgi:hypothetical protein
VLHHHSGVLVGSVAQFRLAADDGPLALGRGA